MRNFFLWFLLVCPEVLRCYFLNQDATDSGLSKTWSPGHWSDQLFGWSMIHFKEDLYVGAPLGNQEVGTLYRCRNLEISPTCEKVKKDSNKMELLQSQAPVDLELSGSSASARHGTFDIGH